MLRQVADAYTSPDAETLQAKASAIRKEVQLRPLIQATKAIIANVRKDPGWMVTRAPLDPLPAADAAALIAKLTELGYPVTV
jgi:hypothetical protein